MDFPLEGKTPPHISEKEAKIGFLGRLIEKVPQAFVRLPKLIQEQTTKILLIMSLVGLLGYFADDAYSLGAALLSGNGEKTSGWLGSYPEGDDNVCTFETYSDQAGIFTFKGGAVRKGSPAAAFVKRTGGKLDCNK